MVFSDNPFSRSNRMAAKRKHDLQISPESRFGATPNLYPLPEFAPVNAPGMSMTTG
jgi:hypothetical protein